MNRGSPSPIFDVPEFPALRRVKPLPKRRRTIVGTDNKNGLSMASTPSGIPIPDLPFFEHIAQQVVQRHFAMTGASTSVDDLVGESDELMGSLSLQDYYLPPMGGSRFVAAAESEADVDGENRNSSNTAAAAAAAVISAVTAAGRNGQMPLPMSDLDSLEFGVHFAAAAAAAGVAMGSLGSLGLGLAGMSLGSNGADTNDPSADTSSTVGRSSGGRSRDEDDGRGDGDYMDHLRQPGNTKKRKVPANMSPGGPEGTVRPGSPSSGYLEEDGGSLEGGTGHSFEDDEVQLQFQRERDRERDRERERSHSPNLHSNFSTPAHPYPPAPFPGQLSMVVRKRGKLMAVTLAGLQHKELLKSRKRQLAAVMGALSHGDTLALDQALTGASYGYRGYGTGALGKANLNAGSADDPHAQARAQGLTVRKSKRRTVRLTRAMKIMLAMPQRRIRHPDAVPFPESEFEFSCPSGTADRLIATKEEVASLRKRFEVELEKQAAKAAKMAVAAATTAHGGAGGTSGGGAGGDGTGKPAKATGGKGKRERQERDRERAERAQAQMQAQALKTKEQSAAVAASVTTVTPTTNTTAPSSNAGDFGIPSAGTAPSGGGKPKGKKKKRSTLANASNPHHLKNYVPSRLPHSGDGGHGGATGNYAGVSPLPIRFLTAQVPPRRKRGQGKRDKENVAEANTPPRGTPTSQAIYGGSLIPLKNPAEEWICAFCEYDLFYGSDAAFRKAVRNRKKILKRRRRARERAAKAASGKLGATAHPPAPPPSEDGDEEEEDLYEEEEVADVQGNGNGQGLKAGRWKGGRGPDG